MQEGGGDTGEGGGGLHFDRQLKETKEPCIIIMEVRLLLWVTQSRLYLYHVELGCDIICTSGNDLMQ